MSNYWRDCNVCGQKILMAQNHYGVWQPLEPDGGGRHEHWSGAAGAASPGSGSSPATTPSTLGWSITSRDLPLTYPTKCWWCDKPVFFHTNGFGDCVLFDRLSWPWEVHACWAEHAADEQSRAVAKAEEDLESIGFDGRFYRPRQEPVEPGRPGHRMRVDGYVADNHALYDKPQQVGLSASSGQATAALVKVDVADGTGRLFPFLLPQPVAKRLNNYSLIRMTGVWRLHDGTPYLLATSYRTRSYDPKADGEAGSWRLRQSLRICYYCGRRLSLKENWGFDPDLHPECGKCSSARGSMAPRQFLALCRRIVSHHAQE